MEHTPARMPPRDAIVMTSVVSGCLLVLLAITWGCSKLDLGAWNFPISMLVSVCKTSLVAYFFMRLRRETSLVRVFAAGGVFWLMILFVFTAVDYAAR